MENRTDATEARLRELKACYQEAKKYSKVNEIEYFLLSREAAKVSIAVIGQSGSGVSTLVKALIGQKKQEAAVDDNDDKFYNPDPTSEAVRYPYRWSPNTVIWDHPGLKTAQQPEQYLSNIKDEYNIVLIAVPDHIDECLLKLITAVYYKGKTVYVIRTKADIDIHTAKRRQRSKFNWKKTLKTMRDQYTEILGKAKLNKVPVFLVSSFELQQFDFFWLQDCLQKDIMGHERKSADNFDEWKHTREDSMKDFYTAFETGEMAALVEKIQSSLSTPEGLKLDIAVTGEDKSGKSTFINALRGLQCDDDGAAEINIVETTRLAKAYQHARFPNVTIWDLPGIGGLKFPPERYSEKVSLHNYDFFIIVTADCYKCVHSTLVKTILSMGKKFYFVRNKIDIDYETCQRREKLKDEKRHVLMTVKQSCLNALKDEGVLSPQVFLVSSTNPSVFDFQNLQDSLAQALVNLKKTAFLQLIPVIITHVIRRRQRDLMAIAWAIAEQICLVSIEDSHIKAGFKLTTILSSFCEQLGLLEPSLRQIEKMTGKAVQQLELSIKSPLAKYTNQEEVLKLVTKCPSWNSTIQSYISFWGSSCTEPVSFTATYKFIKDAIRDLSEDAERVLKTALDCDS
ncbi:interferon-inducible GTPase 5-like [Protopterus annectens]|uniref:interferon-inducible GTPase 5-like n=1 Tax=Protopterus annectens TaxID=7888 RepID=UPI001CFA510D|nr:interferon-inducible GTPase 5-like [Protopterus annectens]